jgi:hypothetical protein
VRPLAVLLEGVGRRELAADTRLQRLPTFLPLDGARERLDKFDLTVAS